jgi:hypothetical protein
VVPTIQTLQILIGFQASSLVVFGIVLHFALPNGDYPPIWVPSVLGSLAVISHLISRTVGFNLKPVPAGAPPTEAIAMARAAFYASAILRFALSELVAIVALSLSFAVLPASWMTYLIGAVLTSILLWLNVWPSPAVISRAQQRLDRDGGQSLLRDTLLGLAPDTTASAVLRP